MQLQVFMLLTTLLLIGNSTLAFSEGAKDCDNALIVATYSRTDKQFVDWRMAENVDEGSWNTITHNGSVNVPIYGVMAGASYGDYKQSINTLKRSNSQSFNSDTFRNVVWTGLDETAARAYSDCLARATKKNLVLIPRTATSADISFDLNYTVVGRSRNPMPVKWTGVETRANHLPPSIYAGTTPVIVKRPTKDSTVAVSGDGLSDSIIVTQMPAPLPPESLFLATCTITATPAPLPALPAGASTAWTCLGPLQKGSYDVRASIQPTASGGAFRVLFSLDVTLTPAGSGPARSARIYDGQMDINASAGLPNAFQGGGVVNVNDGDVARVVLGINGVANHCCFDRTNHHDGTVNIPQSVSIVLKKAG